MFQKRALTFGWRRSGALDRGGGVVVMYSADMYRSLRDIARAAARVMRGEENPFQGLIMCRNLDEMEGG